MAHLCSFDARLPLLLALTLAGGAALAQVTAAAPTAAEGAAQFGGSVPSGAAVGRSQRRVEVIRTENHNSVIEEVRIGGETHSISVQPKGGMPGYEVLPASGTRSRTAFEREGAAGANPSSGPRVWKLFDF